MESRADVNPAARNQLGQIREFFHKREDLLAPPRGIGPIGSLCALNEIEQANNVAQPRLYVMLGNAIRP